MSKPYDAVTKRLIELRPADWVTFLGLPEGEVSLIDSALSTITSYLPRVIRAMRTHIETEAQSNTEVGELWTATNILMGLRYNECLEHNG